MSLENFEDYFFVLITKTREANGKQLGMLSLFCTYSARRSRWEANR